MSSNKHAQIRYKVLDDCFSNFGKKYFFKDLILNCNETLREYYGESSEVKTRTLRSDISYLRDRAGEFGVEIVSTNDGDGFYYRYSKSGFSIFGQGLGENDIAQLKETIMMLQRFSGMPNFDWISEIVVKLEDKLKLKGTEGNALGFEENRFYTGLEWIEELFEAIVNHQVLSIKYRTFSQVSYDWTIHPYYIKQYNNRWFLFGLNDSKSRLSVVPLDRIDDIEQVHREYKQSDINFQTYFDNVVGVTVLNNPLETIRLRFSPERFPYVMTKSLHPSQKIVDVDNCVIEIKVIPNNELDALILSYGKDIEVVSPNSYRTKIQGIVREMILKYAPVQIDCTDMADLCCTNNNNSN